MTALVEVQPSKGHTDENFPVASLIVAPRHRATILAFYRFARAADDVADHPRMAAEEKLRRLDELEATLIGSADSAADALPLRAVLADKKLCPQHGRDLLTAFRRDVTKTRYEDWDDLMDYCRYSAAPVGRFVLDVHGESQSLWPANDALCAALQVINHLQDCGKDYRDLDRVYVPRDALAAVGLDVSALAAPAASPALRRALSGLAHRNAALLERSARFSGGIADFRLGLEVAAIQRLGEQLNSLLIHRDPLSERVHFGKWRFTLIAAGGAAGGFARRVWRRAGDRGGSSIMDSLRLAEIANAVHAKVKGSSFYVALRILPPAQREAMFAIYAFAAMSTTSPTNRAPRTSEGRNWRTGAKISARSTRARPPIARKACWVRRASSD